MYSVRTKRFRNILRHRYCHQSGYVCVSVCFVVNLNTLCDFPKLYVSLPKDVFIIRVCGANSYRLLAEHLWESSVISICYRRMITID